jgi:hypothetical protein
MRIHSGLIVAVAVAALSACTDGIAGPAEKNVEIKPVVVENVQVVGDRIVTIANTKWSLCPNLGTEDSYCPGAELKVRWNGQATGGNGTSFQMDIIWSPACTWDVPLGNGLCIGQHLEVTFYNEHSFGEHALLIRKYVLHLD